MNSNSRPLTTSLTSTARATACADGPLARPPRVNSFSHLAARVFRNHFHFYAHHLTNKTGVEVVHATNLNTASDSAVEGYGGRAGSRAGRSPRTPLPYFRAA